MRSQTLVSGPFSIDGQVTRLYVIEYSEYKWMNGWMDGWMDGWTDKISNLFIIYF